MNKISYLVKTIFITTILLGFCTCKKKEAAVVTYKPFPVQLVYSEAAEPWVLALQSEMEQTPLLLPNQSKVTLELVKESSLNAADKISRGEIKTHLWLTPSTNLREYVNRKLVNLGAAQSECLPVFSSPIVLAALEENTTALGAKSRTLDAHELFRARAPEESKLNISIAKPSKSESGLYSVLQLLQSLVSKQESHEVKTDLIKKTQEIISNYSESEDYLLDRAVEAGNSKASAVILSEQQLIQYNKQKNSSLIPFYFKGASVVKDYQLCISQADWVTLGHKAAIELIKKAALSPSVQKAALSLGFRPDSYSSEELKTYRVKLDQPSERILNQNTEIVADILQNWESYAKPLALTIVLDSSLSFSGDVFARIQNALHHYLSNKQKSTLVSLITFAGSTKEFASFEADPVVLASKVTLLQPTAGTLIYDGLREGLELAISPKTDGYRRRLLLISSSEDKGSTASFESLSSFAVTRLGRSDVDVIAFLDGSGKQDEKELKLLLAQMGASVAPINLDNVYDLLRSVF